MNAKQIYDKLIEKYEIPSSILTWNNKADCIYILITDYNESVYKFAKQFFRGYEDTDVDYTNEHQTCISYNKVSVYSDRETIQAILDFYYQAKAKGLLGYVQESKKSNRKSLKEKKVNYDLVEYEVGVMLNKLGVKSWDFSNEENCEKIEELNDIVFNLVNVLPKL